MLRYCFIFKWLSYSIICFFPLYAAKAYYERMSSYWGHTLIFPNVNFWECVFFHYIMIELWWYLKIAFSRKLPEKSFFKLLFLFSYLVHKFRAYPLVNSTVLHYILLFSHWVEFFQEYTSLWFSQEPLRSDKVTKTHTTRKTS